MKILVPTDLSPLSKIAVKYAAELSVKINASVVLLNVVYIEKPIRAMADFTTDEIMASISNDRRAECLSLINEIKGQVAGELNISCAVVSGGSFGQVVNMYATHHEFDLIIMGTKGAGAIKKVIVGTNAEAVICNSKIPVLSIPEFAIFKGFRDILYASDLKDVRAEFALLLPVAKIFQARIVLLHIYQSGSMPKMDEISLTESLRKDLNYPNIECRYVAASDVKTGIQLYLNGRNADILAMFSGKRNFIDRMFEKSSARDFVFQTSVPLLTFTR